MTYPERRMRRLRRTPALRRLVAETRLSVDDLVAPLFLREGIDGPRPIASMPGVVQHTRESLRKEVRALADLGVPAVILFGVPAAKDASGSAAWDPAGIAQVGLADIRDEVADDLVVTRPRGTAACWPPTAQSTTTPRWPCTPASPWPRPTPAPTSSPPPG